MNNITDTSNIDENNISKDVKIIQTQSSSIIQTQSSSITQNEITINDDNKKNNEISYEEYLRRKRPHVRPIDDDDDNSISYYRSDFD